MYCCVQTLEIEQVRRGPRECDAAGTVPQPRFAHAAVAVALSGGDEGAEQVRWLLFGGAMVVIGGANPPPSPALSHTGDGGHWRREP